MRRPADKTQGTREDLWQLMRSLKQFTMSDINGSVNLHKTSIHAYVKGLLKAGYIKQEEIEPVGGDSTGREREEKGGTFASRYRYRVIKDSLEAPRIRKDGTEVTQGRGREQIWRAMHILKRFDLSSIWAASGTDDHPVAREEVKTYVQYLARARYLKQTGKGEKSIYMLVRYTGRKPPQIQRVKRVWDPNLKKVVWPAQGETGNHE